MAVISYGMCSTVQQDTAAQLESLQAAVVPEELIFSEYVSGAVPCADRLQLQAALIALIPGEQLLLTKLDRLGRTMEECVTRLAAPLNKGYHVKTLDSSVNTKSLGRMAKPVVGVLTVAAELERDLILERTKQGQQSVKDHGVPFGSKRKYTDSWAELVSDQSPGTLDRQSLPLCEGDRYRASGDQREELSGTLGVLRQEGSGGFQLEHHQGTPCHR
jgi:putative DNA-invertase from lambdoid prophage Rac